MRRLLLLLLAALVLGGCSKKEPAQAAHEPEYVFEPVRIASVYTALLEKPDAVNALLLGDGARALTNYFSRAGLLCSTTGGARFDLIVFAGNEMTRESCAKATALLDDDGAFVWLMDVKGVTAEGFCGRLAAFDLPEVHLWMPGETRWVLVGRKAPRRIRLDAMLGLFTRDGAYEDLAAARCGTLPELFANYVGRRDEIMPAFAGADRKAEVRPEFFITKAIPEVDWISAAGVDDDIARSIHAEVRSMQVVRRLVVEGAIASAAATDKKTEEAAIDHWTRAALRNPNDLMLLERIDRLERNARGFLAVQKVLQAMKCYETLVLIRPNDVSAVRNFGLCLKKIGKMDVAEQVLARARKLADEMTKAER